MSVLTLRGIKGSPLTNQEIDDNFSDLNSDKVELGGDLSGNTSSPIVSGIRGFEVSNTTPSENQLLSFSNNSFVFIDTPEGETDLGTSANTTSRTITSSTGNNVIILGANTSEAGFFVSDDKIKLDGIESSAQVNVPTDLSWTTGSTDGPVINSSTGNSATIPVASNTESGVVTTGAQTFAGDKTFEAEVSATNFNSTSDINKKTNIATLVNALSLVNNLRGVSFVWKDTDRQGIGMIAQEVETYLPQVVVTSEDGTKTIQYGNFAGLLIEAIKEQNEQIEDLMARIVKLEDRSP